MMAFLLRMTNFLGKWMGLQTIAHLGIEIAKFTAWKLILAGMWITGIYILCNNIVVYVLNLISSLMPAIFSGDPGGPSMIFQLTGLGAYLAIHLKLVDSFSILIAGLSLAFVRRFLPYPLGG